uniref:Uncharacterized protein n=1 Tax=Arundo donax TaxID=35708 RepID=A0A0A9CUX7_ARUDO
MILYPCVKVHLSLLLCTQELVLLDRCIQGTLQVHSILCLTMRCSLRLLPLFPSHPTLKYFSLYLIIPQEHTQKQPGSRLLWMFYQVTQIILLLLRIRSRVAVLLWHLMRLLNKMNGGQR